MSEQQTVQTKGLMNEASPIGAFARSYKVGM